MSEAVIKCESVYKIFGENAEKMLKEANGNVDAKTLQIAKLAGRDTDTPTNRQAAKR